MQSQTTDSDNVKSNTPAYASEIHNKNSNLNNQLAQRKKIEGTPFYIIKQTTDHDNDKYFLIMGDYRLTEPTETEEETTQKLKTEHWNIVCNIIAITTEKFLKLTPYETEAL